MSKKEKKDMTKKQGSVKGTTAAQAQADFAAKTPEEKGALGHIEAPPEGESTFVLGTPGGVESPIAPIVAEGTTDTTAIEDIGEETIDGDKIPALDVAGTVKPLRLPNSESSLAEIYKMFNPPPKERTPEEQAKYERQRRASGIILGVADAINGLSNLGATVYGAPSREVTPIASKWAEVLDTAEKERQQRVDVYKANLMKYHIEDFKRKQRLADEAAKAKGDAEEFNRRTAAEQESAITLARVKSELDKERDKLQQDAAIELEDKRHSNDLTEIRTRAALTPPKAEEDKPKARNTYFTTSVGGTDVDVFLRSKEDYHKLYDILKPYIEKDVAANDPFAAEMKAIEEELRKFDTGKKEDPDGTRSLALKQNIVRKYFSKYYDKIKGESAYKHLSPEFRDSQGNVIKFPESSAPKLPSDKPSPRDVSIPEEGLLYETESSLQGDSDLPPYLR